MLQRCNPTLPTSDWKVVKVEASKGPTNQAVVILNKESLAPIEAARGELNFGFSSVTMKVYKSDAAAEARSVNNPVEQDVVSEIEAPEVDPEPEPALESYSSETELMFDFEALCRDEILDDSDADITVVENDSNEVSEASAD
ncbi:uncharacterized protein LOC117591565 [Drosophila guanche]|uniref:uncharacterized protein LOC117591565 n=1 Tax=Drosophila guanche TaxID=7266 RepID=UPI001470D2C4|nr:uncharacterized protein LOC117591565 [Drosophila guanche]